MNDSDLRLASEAKENAVLIRRPRRGRNVFAIVLISVALLVGYFMTSIYTVQPIGALPNGATVIVWRTEGAPFFDSPDATCLRRVGGVSLLCRAVALGNGPVLRYKIVSLPYMEWAYLLSTGGKQFDR